MKRVLGIFSVIIVIVLIGFGLFYGGISGRAIDALIKTPIIAGEPLEGSLIIDFAGVPRDSEFVLKLNNQEFTSPVSDVVDRPLSVEEVSFYPEVLLVLEYVPGGDASDFKASTGDGGQIGGNVGDEIIDLPEPPDTKLDKDSGEGNKITGNVVSGDYVVLGVRFGSPVTVRTRDAGFRLVGAEVNGNQIDFDFVNGAPVGRDLIVSTNYRVSVETYVPQPESFVEIDLSEFGVIAEPGILEASILYEGTEVSKVSKSISSLGGLEEQFLISKSVRDIQKLGDAECESSIEVEKCVVDLNPADVFNDDVNSDRITKVVQRKCNEIEVIEIKCSEKKVIDIDRKTHDEVQDSEIDVYDSDSGTLVANVVYDSVDETLDIDFLQSPESYQDSCHNGVWDGDEEGRDCGGNCSKECRSYFGVIWRVALGALVLGLLVFLLFRRVHHGGAINKGRRALDSGRLGRAVNAYRRVQRASASGRLSPEESRKARSFYSRLRKKLSAKGIKVSSERGKGLPKLFYSR